MTLFWALLIAISASADKSSYPEQRFLAKGIKKIVVSGVNGHIKMVGRSGGTYRLKVRHSRGRKFEDWSLLVDRQGSTLVFEVSSVLYGAQWRKVVKKENWPEFDIEVTGPPRPTTISWRDGSLEFRDWTAAVESSQLSGQMHVKNCIGNFNLAVAESDVKVDSLVGSLTIKGEKGKVDVQSLQGPLHLYWVQGPVTLRALKGGGTIDINESQLRLTKSFGPFDVKLARGEAEVDGLSGHLNAEGRSALWKLNLSGASESEVKSESGGVHVRWRKGGAKVFLTSDNGKISGLGLKPILDSEGRQVAEFKLKGAAKGQVFVRTESGPIRFEQ